MSSLYFNTSMNYLIFLFTLFIFNISGCTSTDQRISRLEDPNAVPQKQIDLFDSESFDYKLGLSLLRNLPTVEVKVLSPFSTNKIPERIEKWLAAVDQNGGKVEVKADPLYGKSRGFISEAIDLAMIAYDAVKKSVLYNATDDYDVIVFYNSETGMITKFSFTHRGV